VLEHLQMSNLKYLGQKCLTSETDLQKDE
jgi:hypothetical protein